MMKMHKKQDYKYRYYKMENIVLYAQWENDNLYLKSEKYKIGENNIDIYEENDVYLDKLNQKQQLKNSKANCDTNGTITVLNEKWMNYKRRWFSWNKYDYQSYKKNQEITLTAVVMGDLDGNGKVTATDLSALNQVVLKLIEIKMLNLKLQI